MQRALLNNENESHTDFYLRWHHLADPYFRWQLDQFRPYMGSRIADIGCGLGNFTRYLCDKEFYVGVDPDLNLLTEITKAYGMDGNIKTLQGDICNSSYREHLKSFGIDTVLCVNVIEHIKDDEKALGNMIDSLSPGGTLCLLVPAFPFLYGSLDRLDNHYRRYTKKILKAKLEKFPLRILKMYYFNSVGAIGWFWKGRLLKEKNHSDANYQFMNLLVPILSRLERTLPPFFGLSLIAIAKRT